MCMLRLFEGTKYKLVVAHCNFSLRAESSDGDEDMIRAYCKERSITFESIKFDTLAYADEHKVSTQMAARDLRYPWFESLLKQYGLKWIATAHHAQDSVETALLNLTRGTGLSGLKGILPKSGNLIRPLLFAKKADIISFAEQNEIPWREDSSNASDKYKRNHIRHHVIPLLEELNPKLLENFANTGTRLNNALIYIKSEFGLFKKKYLRNENGSIVIDAEVFFNPEKATLIEFWLGELNFNYDAISAMLASKDSLSGSQFLSKSHRLLFDRETVIVTLREHTVPKIELSIDSLTEELEFDLGKLTFQKLSKFPPKEDLLNPNKAFLNMAHLAYPITLRNWQKGDVFQPFGMKGKKKVSDFLIDEKVPVSEKEKTLVLCSGNEVIWIVGKRISEKIKIDRSTSEVLEITFSAV
ncbi:UNVERIFIED_CONTAM: hypothetical protein GTU68_054145 [Idotea baltica]|nr:hypothetical protein [Idotea baltica]